MVENMVSSTLLLGIGAQRCGTTWLGEHFKKHPDIMMSPIKEMRFFVDPASDPEWHKKRWQKRKQRAIDLGHQLEEDFDERIAMGTSSSDNVDAYKAFFAKRVQGQKYHCEITPSYMALPREDLKQIKSQFENIKIIFLMRDPIARLWSMVRFNHTNQTDEQMNLFARSCLDVGGYRRRCDYRSALENLDDIFDQGEVFIGFYEDLFVGKMLPQLYSFLDIPPVSAELDVRKNNVKSAILPNDVADYFAENLMEQYDYVRDRFGDQVPEGWLL